MERFLVSASTGAMVSLLGKLGTILTDEYKLLKGVRGDIMFLKDELEAMQAFLLMMANVEEPDYQAKLRANAVRELSYDIEDKIDKFMLLVDHEPSPNSDIFREIFSKSMKKIANIKTRHKIAKDIKDIKCQVTSVSERYSRYKIDESSGPRTEKVDPRLWGVYKDVSDLVGIDGPRDKLVKWLNNKVGEPAHRPKVLSIVGYAGLGKTTLARQIYNILGANFDCQAFVSISRRPDMTKILTSILSQLRNQNYGHSGAGDPQLIIDQIRNFLEHRRYFIIMDDLWDIQTWRTLDCVLFKNSCGSVIMTTTRIHDIAESCCSSQGDLVHKIQPLSTSDSKKLFFKTIFGSEEMCPSNLKEASDGILRKCGGSPLAINAISSLLATGKTKKEWDSIRYSIDFAHGKHPDIDAMACILSLSYFDLPLHLRSCLLYLTMFPEDYEIGRRRLVYRWISEGFIRGRDGENLVELGETYFCELVNRSLIQPLNIRYDGKASHCRVHDTILDFLIYKSTEDNFCTVLSNHSKLDSRVRRLSLMRIFGSLEQLNLSHARSLGAFGFFQEHLPSLVNLNSLRVLDLQYCVGLENHHVKDIGKHFQLRYLNISANWNISELPKKIGDLVYLETLDASFTRLVALPESVTRLKRLARLFVPEETKFPDGIGNMCNLQELGDIHAFKQSLNFVEELGKLTNMRKMRIIWDSDKSDEAFHKEKLLVSSLCKLDTCNLHTLCITFCLTEKDATFIRHPLFSPLNSIQEIGLCSGKLCWITNWLLSLVGLKKLTISSRAEIEQQDLEMVGRIHSLVEFELDCRCLGPMIVASGGFPQLQKLELNFGFTGLMFEAGALPNLKKLGIQIHLLEFISGGGGFDIGIQHLSSIDCIRIVIDCSGVRSAEVEAAACAFKSMADAHPSHPTLEMRRELTWLILT